MNQVNHYWLPRDREQIKSILDYFPAPLVVHP